MTLIDLSVTLDNDKSWAPWWARNKVIRQSHAFGRLTVCLLLRLTPGYLRGRLGWANDVIKISTHGTTHLDAPWHYAPLSEGKPAKTIDQVPLEWWSVAAPTFFSSMVSSRLQYGSLLVTGVIATWKNWQRW